MKAKELQSEAPRRLAVMSAVFAFVLVLIAILSYGLGAMRSAPSEEKMTLKLEKAPNFVWRDLNDPEKPIYFESLRGKTVFLNYWAAWCIFCIREMPDLERLSQDYRDRGLVIMGIHRSDTEKAALGLEFAAKQGVTYQLLNDGTRGNSFAYFSRGSQLMPLSVIIDKEGYVREVIFGPRSIDQWRSLLEPVF